MDILEAIQARHSVRSYTDQAIPTDVREQLQAEIDACNAEGGLHMQLVCDDAEAFQKGEKGYGQFENVRNYLAVVGPAGKDVECGYYGQRVVLLAQQLGLNSCWVALTFNKKGAHFDLAAGEKLYLVIALGYGATQGTGHKVKDVAQVSRVADGGTAPEWFTRGVETALLAPTAMNQQRFTFTLEDAGADGKPRVTAKGSFMPYAKLDLGIAKYHFEVAAGTENFTWA